MSLFFKLKFMLERIWRDMFKLTNWWKEVFLNTKELLEFKEEIKSINSSLLDELEGK